MSNRRPGAISIWVLAAFALLFLTSVSLSSQDDRRARRSRTRRNAQVEMTDSLPQLSDSARHVLDSIHVADSIFRADSMALLKSSSLEQPAFTQAKDSLVEDFSDGKQKIYYYGDVTVTYGGLKLTADYIEYDVASRTVYARGSKDAYGEVKGSPVMEDGSSKYEMEEVWYNFNTRKARINNMSTQEDQGLLHGKTIKMMPDQSINMKHGQYTVCDCEHPHYYLKMSSAKVMTQPSQKTVFGPANVVIEDVNLPVGIPFGFLPKMPDRATGLLMPTFGEETARGFYLRDLGMYYVLGDYFDVSLTGDIYTLGSWSVDLNSRYKVNYKFTGTVGLTYSNDQTGEKGTSDFFQTKNFAVKWSHQQDSKAHPGTSFSASVNFSSPSNSRYNATSVSEALQNQISSSISYSKNWNGKMNLSVNALHSQNSRDSSYTFTLPNLTFSVTRFYPFKKKNRVGSEKFYEKFSLGYNTSFQNKINFKASEFGQDGFLDKFQNGMTHNFSIGLPNFMLAKYINVTPSLSYGMNWYFKKTEKQVVETVDEETGEKKIEVVDVSTKNFGAFGTTHNYSGAISASTRLYGMFQFGKHHKVQAIRHVFTPSLSLSASPEKGKYFNGWRDLSYTDAEGNLQNINYNIYSGQLNSPPGKGSSATASLQLGNNLEAKVRDFADTTGKGTKKVKILDQLNFSGNYNFLADSLRLSNIGATMSTNVLGKLGINANANFDPYAINEKGVKINTFNVVKTGHLARLTNASVSLSWSISGKGTTKGIDGGGVNAGSGGGGTQGAAANYTRIYYHPITGEYIPGGYVYYMNTNAPWSLSFSYSYQYSRSYQYTNEQLIKKNNHTQTLNISGNVKLTPAFSVNMTSGFDIMALKLTTTQLSATYDLHCFNIAVSWVPTGKWQSWSFRISANASALADLLQFKKSSSFWDN